MSARVVRISRAALHVAVAVCKLGLLAPRWHPARRRHEVERWSRKVFRIFGIDLAISGALPVRSDTPLLVVANHISWLDIYALLAAGEMRFVAKAEVQGWPVVGHLAAQLGTLFIERGRRASSRTTSAAIRALLERGEPVCVFPEGTTTDGRHIEPFRAPLLEPASGLGARVQPVAIRYRDADGHANAAVPFTGAMSLPESLWRLAGAGRSRAEVHFLAPFLAAGLDRRSVAAEAERRIAAFLALPVFSQPAEPLRAEGDSAIAFDIAAR